MLSASEIDQYETLLLELNRAARLAILPHFRSELTLENKADPDRAYDPVTRADREAEAAIRQILALRHPDHGVIGEEYGEDRPEAEHVWILDPVDGTRAFVAGLPLWTTLIGLRIGGETSLGSIGQGFLDEVFLGSPAGSRLIRSGISQPLQTRRNPALSTSIIATTDADACFTPAERAGWLRLRAASRLARMGCDAYAYAMLAAGHIDVVIESGLKIWDIQPAIPVIINAGGAVTNWQARPLGQDCGQVILAASADLAASVANVLAEPAR